MKRLKYIANLKSGNSITSSQIKECEEYPVYGENGFRGYTSSYTHVGDFVLIGRQGALCGNINYAHQNGIGLKICPRRDLNPGHKLERLT